MNKVVKNVALVFVLVLLFVPTILVLLDLLSMTPWAGSTTAMFFDFFSILYTATIPAIALKVLELFGCCSTPQPTLQSSYQLSSNPPSGTPGLFPQNLAQTRNPLSDQGHGSSTNEDKARKIEFGASIVIALTFLISFIVFVLTNSIMSFMIVFGSMLPSMTVLYAIVYAFSEYWQESQGHGSSTNEDKTMKIACTVFITIALTLLINSFIVALTFHNPYSYSMYLQPGIYIFTPNGNYYYYHPYGWPASNTTLVVLGGGDIGINGWVYPNTVTVQPGNYSFMITLTDPNIMINYFIDTIPTSALISLIIAMILCELVQRVSRSEKH